MKEESPNTMVFTTSKFPVPLFNSGGVFAGMAKFTIGLRNHQKDPERFNDFKTAYYSLEPEPFVIK